MFDDCSVLIVDDQSTSRAILSQVVRNISKKANVVEKTNPKLALEWAAEHTSDLVLVDYMMPEMSGIEFVRQLKAFPQYEFVPVIMITINKDSAIRYAALEVGVTDFLSKPVDIHECTARSRNLLTLHKQQIALENKSILLESLVQAATAEIKAREKETLMRLARAGEYKDYDTAMHLQRMSQYSKALAIAIGMTTEEADIIELASPLHDIGKIGIPDSILLKKGLLNQEELITMRKHPIMGYEILQDSPSMYLQKGSEIALAHHERYDGTGYPYGLKANDIPLSARIVAVADVFDALTSKRPYKEAWSIDQSLDYLKNESGKHFDPELVTAMLSIRPDIEKIYQNYNLT